MNNAGLERLRKAIQKSKPTKLDSAMIERINRLLNERTCIVCGKVYQKNKATKYSKCCSDKCAKIRRKQTQKEWYLKEWGHLKEQNKTSKEDL